MKYNITNKFKLLVLSLLPLFLTTQTFAQCPTLFSTSATTNVACSGDQVTFTALLNPADAQNGSLFVDMGSGNVLIPSLTGPNPSGLYTGSLTLENDGCYPVTQSFSIKLQCTDDNSISAIQTEDITVYPSNVEEFVTIEGDDCSVSIGLSEACTDENGELFLNVEPAGYSAEPGESGTWTINYNFVDKLGFNPCPEGSLDGTIEYDYNCFDPCGNSAGDMGGSNFVCGDAGFLVSPIDNGAVVDAGSTLVFIIHDGTSAQVGPNIYAVVGPGEPIMNDGAIPTNVALCFSAVVGDQLDANGVPQPGGCYDISNECQTVIFLPPITISASEICDPATGQYDVQVMINGGGPAFFPGHTYTLTGALSGEVFASDFNTFGPFNSGDTYSFEIADDGKGCRASYEGTTMCEITPDCDAGVLGGNAFVCDGDFTVASTVGEEIPDDGTLVYVLHDGSSDALGDVFASSSDGVFTNDGTIPTNVTLCVTAVVGNNVGADGIPTPDTSNCYDISNCFQAVFLDAINVVTTEICDEQTGQYNVEVNISGGGPAFFTGHTYSITGDYEGEAQIDETLVLGPFESNYTYSFNVVEDGKGCALDEPITGTADCGVYDLALTKTVASPGPFTPGSDVLFTILVINQGNVDAANVEVTDYIPAGLALSANDNNGWAVSGSNATTTISSIPAGSTSIVSILLTIDEGQGEGPIVNYAEISGDDGEDVDSNTDQDVANDAGGMPNTSTDNSTNGTKGGTDEDDHDPAQIDVTIPAVYDLALVKTVSSAGPFMPGDDVTFTIEVINQGGVDANNVEVTDYIPSGMSLSSADNNGWVVSGSNATATIASIASGASATIDIVLTIDATQGAGSLVNYAEISADDGEDADSNTDQDAGNDAGGMPNTSTDDSTDGTKGGTDEDDHDPAQIDVTVPAIYDLALIKTITYSGPYMPGSDVTFSIQVINQGDVDANNVEITDYIPTGLSLSTNDNNGWIVNGSLATVNISSIPVGGSESVDIVLTIDAGQADGTIVNYAEIIGDDGEDADSNTDQDVANDAGGQPNTSTDNSTDGTKGGTDEDDHDPAQIEVMTAIVTGCTDPCASNYDPLAETNNGECEPYSTDCNTDCTIGDLEVWNAATCSCIISLPTILGCMDMAACNFDSNANCEDNSLCDYGNSACADPCNPVSGCTDPAACNYDPNACVDNGSCDLGDPTCPGNPCNPTPGCTDPAACNYDPNACVSDGSCDLGNVTCADPCNPVLGCTNMAACNYDPNACEENGTCDFGDDTCTANPCDPTPGCTNPAACNYDTNACVDDGSCDLGDPTCPSNPCNPTPGCTDPAACNYNPNACVDNGTCQAIPTCNDDPCVGDITRLSTDRCSCELVTPQVLGCTDTAACNYDSTANCDDGSCEPCEVFDLALIKDISPNLTAANMDIYCPGDEVRFSIAVFNQGDFSAMDIEITDYIPEGMSLSDNPANSIWLVNGSMAVTTIPFIEANGGVVGLTIFLTIDEDYAGATLENYAEISGDNGDDHDSNADNILGNDAGGVPNTPADNDINGVKGGFDEDDHDGDIIYLCNPDGIYDLALTKDLSNSNSEYSPGDDVMYDITVYNQGDIPAYNIQVTDYIPEGFSLSVNDNNGWTTNGDVAMNILTYVAPGESVSISILLTIGEDHPGGSVVNYAEISNDDGNDADSTPDTDPNNDAGGEPGTPNDNNVDGNGTDDEDDHDPAIITVVPGDPPAPGFDLALTKMVAAGQPINFVAGDPVTFTITVYNQGIVTATNVGIIDYAPSSLILNDPDWTILSNNNATTVIPGPIAPGETASVDISFIVDPDLFHAKDIVNYAEIQFATDENGNAVSDIDSNFDSSVGNDAGGAPGTPADDYIDGNGTGNQGDGVAATDEDDADPAAISVITEECNAGVLPSNLYSCTGGVISVSSTGALIPNGYEYVYILHDGDEQNLGNIIEVNTTGVFSSNDYPVNTPLIVQALVGPPNLVPNDLPVLCDLSNAATLVFLEPIVIEADFTCDPETEEYTVTFTITGGLPGFDPTQAYDVTGDYSSNVTANTPITFGPIADTSYDIIVSDDAGCSATYSEIVECVKLPVTLIRFEGEAQQNGNMLKWVTGSETDNDYFTLEVSKDGVQFEDITTVKGAGNTSNTSNYSYLHRSALAGLSYYRLSQTDFDGTTVKLQIIEIARGENALGIISLLPVPVLENLQLTFTSSTNTSTQVEIVDAIGRNVIVENVNQKTDIHNMEINVSDLTPGVYFVRLKAGDNVVSQKFIKE